jgi:alpha-galactosidase
MLFAMGTSATAGSPLAIPVRLPVDTTLPGPITDYEVLRATSGFSREYLLQGGRLPKTGLTLRCTKGRSCADDRPWLLLRHQQTKKGLALAVAYPGNWQIQVESTPEGRARLRADTLPENLPVFETIHGLPVPGALLAEFTGDWDNGAQPIVRFLRAKLRRSLGDDWPWVQYNTWYDRYAKLDEAHLLETARLAAKLGCELFVVDAGWYGRNPNWSAALGDWQVNKQRLPSGLKPVADSVRSLGMKFGL